MEVKRMITSCISCFQKIVLKEYTILIVALHAIIDFTYENSFLLYGFLYNLVLLNKH